MQYKYPKKVEFKGTPTEIICDFRTDAKDEETFKVKDLYTTGIMPVMSKKEGFLDTEENVKKAEKSLQEAPTYKRAEQRDGWDKLLD